MNRKTLKRWIARGIRILTVPPLMSLILFTVLYIRGGVFGSPWQYIMSLLFLTVLPLCAYPLQKLLPSFRSKGRNGGRTLAMIMSCIGYVLSILYAVAFSVGKNLMILFLTYLISGAVLLIINKVFGVRASGHACGLMGPVAVLAYFMGWLPLVIGALLFALTMWGSLKIRRHTAFQFIIGACIPVIVFFSLCSFI